jgi:hypothetical protein
MVGKLQESLAATNCQHTFLMAMYNMRWQCKICIGNVCIESELKALAITPQKHLECEPFIRSTTAGKQQTKIKIVYTFALKTASQVLAS